MNTDGDKWTRVYYCLGRCPPARIIPTDSCEINNNLSVVKEIIEHILKAGYQQKARPGDGRYQNNDTKLAMSQRKEVGTRYNKRLLDNGSA